MTSSALGAKPATPQSGAYLGAYVNPENTGGSITQICPFEQQIDRSLAVDNHFLTWNTPMPGTPGQSGTAADFDVSNGTIPMLSWACSSSATDADIASGADDAWIATQADAIKDFGYPVFIRWFWEMDLTTPASQACEGTVGQPNNVEGGPEYIKAYQEIVKVFQQEGATNVAFVWCPSSFAFAATDPASGGAANFFPGSSFVDWIAEDVYDKPGSGATPETAIAPFYSATSGMGKPLMIAETGAIGSDQRSWIWGFSEKQFATTFPDIKSVNYYDAPNYTQHSRWELEARGIAAFTKLGQKPYFSPMG